MGYDITLHPFSRKEFKYFIEEVVEKPETIDSRVAAIHNKETERAFIVDAIYSNIPAFKIDIDKNGVEVEKTTGMLSAAIMGYLHPYWYLRNGLLADLLDHELFSGLNTNLAALVKEENKKYFASGEGIIENYSSGFYLTFQQVTKLNDELSRPDSRKVAEKFLGDENYSLLKKCFTYCMENELDLLEASDIYVPFSGENSSYHLNVRAAHLKNISDFTNYSQKKIPAKFNDKNAKYKITKTWWKKLNPSW